MRSSIKPYVTHLPGSADRLFARNFDSLNIARPRRLYTLSLFRERVFTMAGLCTAGGRLYTYINIRGRRGFWLGFLLRKEVSDVVRVVMVLNSAFVGRIYV